MRVIKKLKCYWFKRGSNKNFDLMLRFRGRKSPPIYL